MIIFEHIYNTDGYKANEIEVRETDKQFRIVDRRKCFIGYKSTLSKTEIDIPFTRYSIFAMYSLWESHDGFLAYVDGELLKRVNSAQAVLDNCKLDYEMAKARMEQEG